jgi:hypothetical protein
MIFASAPLKNGRNDYVFNIAATRPPLPQGRPLPQRRPERAHDAPRPIMPNGRRGLPSRRQVGEASLGGPRGCRLGWPASGRGRARRVFRGPSDRLRRRADHLVRGVALSAVAGRMPEAVSEFREAVRLNPGSAVAHYCLATSASSGWAAPSARRPSTSRELWRSGLTLTRRAGCWRPLGRRVADRPAADPRGPRRVGFG